MRIVLILLSLLLACGSRPTDRINVILIVVDTMRADRIGCYGYTEIETPSLDRLAAGGVRFSNAISQAPYTLPSICSILTGAYPYRHQVRDNEMDLHESVPTLATEFQKAGYRTGAIAGSAVLTADRKLARGFDHYDDDFPEALPVFNQKLRDANVGLGSRAQRRAREVTNLAISWLRRDSEKPFFLFAHYFDPHSLYDPPEPYASTYADRPYDGEIAYTDKEIGRLLEYLVDNDLVENTLIVVTADHGEGLGDHLEPQHGFFVYDATVRVPLIFALPRSIPAGTEVKSVVGSVDIAATIAEVAGVELDGPIDGRSLASVFEGETLEPVPTYTEAFRGYFGYGWAPVRGIRTESWKYIDAPKPELYKLHSDPGELENLWQEEHPVAVRLRDVLEDRLHEEKMQQRLDVGLGEMNEAQIERLQALGYVTRARKKLGDSYEDLPDPKDMMEAHSNRLQAKLITNLASPHIDSGEYEKAAEFLRGALNLDPDQPVALENLARIELLGENFVAAESLFRRAIAVNPENVELSANLAACLMGQERFRDAVLLLEECVQRAPEDKRYQGALEAATALANGKSILRGESQ